MPQVQLTMCRRLLDQMDWLPEKRKVAETLKLTQVLYKFELLSINF